MTKEQAGSLKLLTDDLIQAETACATSHLRRNEAESKLVQFIDSLAEPAKRGRPRKSAEKPTILPGSLDLKEPGK